MRNYDIVLYNQEIDEETGRYKIKIGNGILATDKKD